MNNLAGEPAMQPVAEQLRRDLARLVLQAMELDE
jgi:hypothetical protein